MKRATVKVAASMGKAAAKASAKAALGSSKGRWTSLGAVAGVGATMSLPAMGLAAFGGAMSLWWGILLLPLVLLGALIGNWVGLLRENSRLRLEVSAATPPSTVCSPPSPQASAPKGTVA